MRLRDEDLRQWLAVAATVRPLAGRSATGLQSAATNGRRALQARSGPIHATAPKVLAPPAAIEPGRLRRLTRRREAIAARLDLHGCSQDEARAALGAFIEAAHRRGDRGVLVVTGKGTLGDGVLRRRTPEWLAEPPLRALVAGVSEAHRRHGGAGALYVALKRRTAAD